MKKKTFFYKFDKNKEVTPPNYHNNIIDDIDDEKVTTSFITYIQKLDGFLSMVDSQIESLDSYYSYRAKIKRDFVEKNSYLLEFEDYLKDSGKYIFTLKFNKILSEREIDFFTENYPSNLIRVSCFDTQIEIVTKEKYQFLNKIKSAFKNEVEKISQMLLNKTYYEEFDSITLSLQEVNIDASQRQILGNGFEEFESENNSIELTFAKQYIEDKDYKILGVLYNKYKTSASSVKIDKESLDGKNDDTINGGILFHNMPLEFYHSVIILLDGLIHIEILTSQLERDLEYGGEYNIVLGDSFESDDEDRALTKVCIVDSEIKDCSFTRGLVEIGTKVQDKDTSKIHGTRVGLLAMYGKINDVYTPLGNPDCKLYNIVRVSNVYSHIESIITEAENNGCKIINISLGPRYSYLKDNESISNLARRIDALLQNKDILLIMSCGNHKSNSLKLETSNINEPKDSFSSICVGGISEYNKIAEYSRKNNISPSIEIGNRKGSLLRLRDIKKPDFIDWGDNIVYDTSFWKYAGGTSFASPLVVNKAAKILNQYEKISSNTIKCLFSNYSNYNQIDKSNPCYEGDDDLYFRHIGKGNIDIDSILGDDYNTINIVIEDYIQNDQKKEYAISLPKIEEDIEIEMKRSLSYNPPVSKKYHFKYSQFCVTSQCWSDYYQNKMDEIFSDENITDTEKKDNWSCWKKMSWKYPGKTDNIYIRPINFVNYFKNQLWVANSYRRNILNKDLYNELIEGFRVRIQGHSRNGFKHTQKYSFVITLNISQIKDKETYIRKLLTLNSNTLIEGVDLENVNNNFDSRNIEFITINDSLDIDIEEFI